MLKRPASAGRLSFSGKAGRGPGVGIIVVTEAQRVEVGGDTHDVGHHVLHDHAGVAGTVVVSSAGVSAPVGDGWPYSQRRQLPTVEAGKYFTRRGRRWVLSSPVQTR
jgi:hypothetical protein